MSEMTQEIGSLRGVMVKDEAGTSSQYGIEKDDVHKVGVVEGLLVEE